jgi:murein DD-endopeptidase MepM/ murein hydrolase activator NlpD
MNYKCFYNIITQTINCVQIRYWSCTSSKYGGGLKLIKIYFIDFFYVYFIDFFYVFYFNKEEGITLVEMMIVCGIIGIFSLAANGLAYPNLLERVDFYSRQFSQWHSTISALKEVDEDFRRIFSLPSKEKILETIDTSYSGSVDIQNLMSELQKSIETVDEIKDYLRIQKDIYLATPKGYPISGNVTSPYGKRDHPFTKINSFPTGQDRWLEKSCFRIN